MRILIAAAVAILAAATSAGAQATREEARVALVIGNSTYREVPLRNPVNDVRAMAKTLRELGFTVLAHENANKRTMETAIIEFGRRLADGGVGFFYYATTPATACRSAGATTWCRSTPRSTTRPAPGSPPSTWSC